MTFVIFLPWQMAVELDVFVGNTTIMDEEVYQFWLDGYTGELTLTDRNPNTG